MASVSQWPGSGRDALMEELNSDLAGESSADLAANALALKILCIRAEIQTDTPTPAEDQALRREHQLQRLVQSMGQGLGADETSLDTMAIDRSEEHTSELQSLMRLSSAVFCLNKKKNKR